MSNPYKFVNSINDKTAKIPIDNDYVPYIINKTLSYFPETFLHASNMNRYYGLPNQLQYDYYFNSVRKGKRFAKWSKKINLEDLEIVKEYFKYSTRHAEDALKILTLEQINEIKEATRKGGV
jgi:hypothetical protein